MENKAKVSLRVYPNASRNEVVGLAGEVWRVRVAAPPVKGKANRELLAFLSKCLGVPRGALALVRGQTSRNKVIAVAGLSHEELFERLRRISQGGQ
ncbi:MAG: YggU family protein [Dehalococcoidales bacterium]|nr:YggU family protein [Dehalococcoidales bacterium]